MDEISPNSIAKWNMQKWESFSQGLQTVLTEEPLNRWSLIIASCLCLAGVSATSYFSVKGLGILKINMNETETSTLFNTISPAILTNSITFSALILSLLTFRHIPNYLEKTYQDELQRYFAAIVFFFGIYNFDVLYEACQVYPSFFIVGILFGTKKFYSF